jgi:hypothetical protein
MLAYSMQRTIVILSLALAAITLFYAVAFCQSDSTSQNDRYYLTRAELLRFDNERLYLWVDAPFTVTTDFRISVSTDGQSVGDCAVAATAEQVVISESLAPALFNKLQSTAKPVFSICLDTARVDDLTIRVGMPAIFADEYSFTMPLGRVNQLPIAAYYHYYRNLTEAEIDLAIGKIDLLIVPETEIAEDAKCSYRVEPTGNYVEWFFLSNLPDNDLYTCALSYCLKNQFVGSNELPTLLMDTSLVNRGYPRNKEKARALFGQVKTTLPSRGCKFESSMLPGLIGKIERELQNCGGRLSFDSRADSIGIKLLHDAQPAIVSVEQLLLHDDHRQFLANCLNRGWLKRSNLPDSCRAADSLTAVCEQELQKWLSRECRFIPLGSMELIALVRDNVHSISDRTGQFVITNFYRAK